MSGEDQIYCDLAHDACLRTIKLSTSAELLRNLRTSMISRDVFILAGV